MLLFVGAKPCAGRGLIGRPGNLGLPCPFGRLPAVLAGFGNHGNVLGGAGEMDHADGGSFRTRCGDCDGRDTGVLLPAVGRRSRETFAKAAFERLVRIIRFGRWRDLDVALAADRVPLSELLSSLPLPSPEDLPRKAFVSRLIHPDSFGCSSSSLVAAAFCI